MKMSKELMVMLYKNMVRVRTLDDKAYREPFRRKDRNVFP